jgi:excisionase family DNA binding protein
MQLKKQIDIQMFPPYSERGGFTLGRIEKEPEVVRIAEAARRLQVSIWTARQWAYRGRIASVKLGKHLLIPTSEIARLIAEGTRPRIEAGAQ